MLARKGDASKQWTYNRIRRELAGIIGTAWVQKYNRYLDTLQAEGKAVNTISNHMAAIHHVLNVAYKRRMIDDKPIREAEIKRVYRKRVLSEDERKRLENVMLECKSHLYWSVRFSELRPIRKNDLWSLTRENLILFGDVPPHIRFRAQKTSNRTETETCLPLADLPEMLSYFHSLPAGCPWLFPDNAGRKRTGKRCLRAPGFQISISTT